MGAPFVGNNSRYGPMTTAPHLAASGPSARVVNAATGFAAFLAIGVFAIDVWVRHSVELGVLYVVPLLVGALGSPPRFLPIAGVVASILTIAAGWIVDGASSSIGWGYRAIGLAVIWTAVIVLIRARQTWLALQSRTKEL